SKRCCCDRSLRHFGTDRLPGRFAQEGACSWPRSCGSANAGHAPGARRPWVAPVFGRAPSQPCEAAMTRLDFYDTTALLTLDRGGARNALPIAAWDAIAEAVAQVGARNASVLILQSAMPGMFSAGADLSEFPALIAD